MHIYSHLDLNEFEPLDLRFAQNSLGKQKGGKKRETTFILHWHIGERRLRARKKL